MNVMASNVLTHKGLYEVMRGAMCRTFSGYSPIFS